MTNAFPKCKCRVCGVEDFYRPGAAGQIQLLPRDWSLFEDKTPERSKAMAEVCSTRCISRLKELNKQANNRRTGW
jgi:hypothetical protein